MKLHVGELFLLNVIFSFFNLQSKQDISSVCLSLKQIYLDILVLQCLFFLTYGALNIFFSSHWALQKKKFSEYITE